MNDQSAIVKHDGGTSFNGPEAVNLFACIAVKHALKLYIKTGMKANRDYTPANMKAFVTRHTGKDYARSAKGLQQAHDDLDAYIEKARPSVPVVDATTRTPSGEVK